ncbi:GntR family transcriptional regulator [Modestobacter marinus]|uniref:GntR family transcriptional regulator n=1 Tax=Modestobacter marinus TaxID=477641 RepID=A0A846M3U7_9ACTN|nr:GntR family transcriptional regulator [Modestobacter marinus]NIH70309.1 GntR family transcriptional regulator [Modestobacter marinus]GGL86193.1 GntR family transcriptional regulator [Modestobacter marinus]
MKIVDVTVDLASPIPPYEQIRGQIAAVIDSGQLEEGTRLPSMRALAGDLGVAIGTVARAYRELEGAGLVASRRRLGTVVAASSVSAADAGDVRQAAAELASRAHRAGLSEETALSLLRAALVALRA